MNYYIADMHLFHRNVTEEGTNFDGRPYRTMAKMHEDMKEKWNRKLTNADHVYIFGDLAWQVNDASIALVNTLKDNKHLIIGNHDKFNNLRFKQLFREIAPYKEIDDRVGGKNIKAVLSHYPIAFWNGMRRGWIHLYGHVHANSEEQDYQAFISGFGKKYGGEYIARNVGCMHWHYEPVSLEEILAAGSAGYPGMGKAKGAETQPAPQEGS